MNLRFMMLALLVLGPTLAYASNLSGELTSVLGDLPALDARGAACTQYYDEGTMFSSPIKDYIAQARSSVTEMLKVANQDPGQACSEGGSLFQVLDNANRFKDAYDYTASGTPDPRLCAEPYNGKTALQDVNDLLVRIQAIQSMCGGD